MNEELPNQIAGLIRAAVPVIVSVIVLNGWLPATIAGQFVDAALIIVATGLSMISSWKSNKPKTEEKIAPLVPPV